MGEDWNDKAVFKVYLKPCKIITNQITVFCRHAILRIQGMTSQLGQIGAEIRFNASRQIKQ